MGSRADRHVSCSVQNVNPGCHSSKNMMSWVLSSTETFWLLRKADQTH